MMKKTFLLLLAMALAFPFCAAAQTDPAPPASWVAFQKDENAKRVAFFEELKADREAFLNSHPDVKDYLQQLHEAAKARRAAWLAAHH